MKLRIIIILAAFTMLAACHKPSSSTPVDSDDVMALTSWSDTIVCKGDTVIHAPMRYWDFDKVDSLLEFFDSLGCDHPFLLLDIHESLLDDVGECIYQLEAYRRGERRYYPDSLVRYCIKWMQIEWMVAYRDYETANDRCFFEWFMMCAAYYSPDITWFVEGQTPDHNAGFCNFGNAYRAFPCCSYVFLKRDKGFEVECIGEGIEVESIFLLTDEQNRTYYLCSQNMPILFGQWLYWRNEQGEYLRVAEYTDTPDECEENDMFYFSPDKLLWKYSRIDKDGDLVALRDEPALRLFLNGANSRIE